MDAVDEILYAWGPGENRLALLARGRLCELALERADLVAGAVFLGRVTEIARGFDGAFVEIGRDRPGFLAGRAGLSQGDTVLVQVRADGAGGKGPILTRSVTVSGRWLALSLDRPGVSCSRKLPAPEQERLGALATAWCAEGEGLAVRTAARGRTDEEMAAELADLRTDMAAIAAGRAERRKPGLVWRPDMLARVLADNPAVTRVRVDDGALAGRLKARFGDLVSHQRGDLLADVEEDMEAALAPVVGLPSGGRLAIEPTAALTAIDVDSGGGKAAEANREAVGAIARHLRLRAIGGQVVVDFVSGGKGGMPALAAALKQAVAADPVPVHVYGATRLGLVEAVRERRGPSLAELMVESETRPTLAAAAFAALRRAVADSDRRPGRALALVAAPDLAGALRSRWGDAVAEAEARIGRPLAIRTDAGRARDDVAILEDQG